MAIHPTSVTFHDCRIHLEPIGPEPGIPEQRYRFHVEHCAATESILSSVIRKWVIGNEPDVPTPPWETRIAEYEERTKILAERIRVREERIEQLQRNLAERDERIDGLRHDLNRAKLQMNNANLFWAEEERKHNATVAERDALAKRCSEAEQAGRNAMLLVKKTQEERDEQVKSLTRECDELRQMHKERAFYDRAQLERQITELDDKLTKLRRAAEKVAQVGIMTMDDRLRHIYELREALR